MSASLPASPEELEIRKEEALKVLAAALHAYSALHPKKQTPTEPPNIGPVLMHAAPQNFHLGYNMSLDAGGYMPGKIPVLVVPIRPEDIKHYSQKRTVNAVLAAIGVPNFAIKTRTKL